MFTLKKLASLTITALCLLAPMLIWATPASGQSGADASPTCSPAPLLPCSCAPVLNLPHDVDRLANGHTLITDGGQPGGATAAQPGSGSKIIEVDADGNVVWLFPSIRLRLLRAGDQGLDWAHNADRLPNGNTLISDTGHDRVIEIDAAGTIVWDSDDVALSDGSALDYPNDANWLPDDHLLITDRDNHRVIEIARDGTIVWQFGETGAPGNDDSHLNGPHNADRLSTGNTIVADSNNNRIIEVAPDGSIVWQYPPPPPARSRLRTSALPLLDWPRDADRLSNGNTLITDSRHDRIIEVTPSGQVVWEYDDLELPYDADRLPNGHTLISGAPGGGVIEVDVTGAIVWQYPPAPTGTIAGTVQDTGGLPVSGTTVTVFGTSLSDTTDASGQYAIADVPAAAPRYVVTASKSGYLDAQAGDVDVTEGTTTTVDFTLEAGSQVTETLHAMIGYIVYRDPSSELLIPPATAVLSPTLYPAEVLPYLQPGQYIESDDAAIVAVAQSILAGLTPQQRTEQTTVAHAVYVWMVQNIAYDLVNNYPGDVTCGNWQTTYGAWGHSFADWLYTAEELLEEGRGICIEHARLATALLRAVGIPARPAPLMAHPVTQWWVQLPDGSGFWANMDTSVGRAKYVDSGDLWANFPSTEEHNLGFWAIDADAPIHIDWWTDNPCIWTEDYGGSRQYPATADGLAQAQAGLDYFAQTGELPAPVTPPPPNQPYYKLSTRGFEVDLTNASDQTHFEISFTLAIETDYLERIDQAHWTNHPDWVTSAGLDPDSDPTTGESLTWYVLELDRQQEPTDEDSPFGFHPAGVFKPGYPDNGYSDATNIGVRWAREGVYAFWFLVQPDLNQQVYDFSLYDQQYGSIPTDLNILANIAPQGPIDEGRCLPGSWLPVDEAQYTAFVVATIERYDGDGIDDMPGLVNPIKHWQVGNEPDDQRRSDFAELQRITYQSIKQACPDCTVLIGGVPGGPGNYVANFDVRYAPILAELGGQYVDVFDFHWYGTATGDYRLRDAATGEDVLEHIRTTLTANGFATDLPLWITEMGSYSGDPAGQFPFQTERQQALDYFKRFVYSLSRGVQKVFPAFGLIEGFKHDDGYFDHTGLIYDGADSGDLGLGVKKLAYYTYKKMTEKLEGADWSTLTTLHDGTDSDHLYLFRVEKACTERSRSDGRPIHIAWWDYFDEPGYTPGDTRPITLTGLTSTAITVTTVVPAADTGQEVTDYATAFTVTTYPASDGSATIVLGEDPVLVEGGEQPPPSILASIVMHNEEPLSGLYPDFVNDEPAFWQHRAALVQFVNMLHANGVMFNYQSDWNFLMAAALYDTGTPETNGKNVVRYIKDLDFEVDLHAHETQYNYADVACLIEALGVIPSHTAGGFLADPPEDSKLEYLWQPITATLIPTYTWQAEILWGGATLLHVNEESLWASGVWKPKDKYHFLEHDDAAPLPHVGGYGRDCDRLIQKQQNGELEEDKIHTCTIFVSQNNLLRPGFIQGFEQQIQDHNTAGDVLWVGLAEVIDIWQTEYDSEPNIVPYLTPTPTPTPTPQPRIYLPLILKSYHPPLVTPTPTPTSTPTPEPGACEAITQVDNSLYYEGSDDDCWHKEDLPSPQPWFEETIPPDVGSTTTPLYFGIGVHIEPQATYMDNAVYQRDRERLRRLAEIVAEHGGVLTIQTQTPFDDKAQQLGDTIFADLAAQGHEIALHFHEDAHIPDADNRPVEEWVTTLEEEIDLIETLSGTEVRTWSGGNVYDHLYEAAEAAGLEVNINYKNPQTQQSDERFTILTPWRPAGASSMEERTTHDPD